MIRAAFLGAVLASPIWLASSTWTEGRALPTWGAKISGYIVNDGDSLSTTTGPAGPGTTVTILNFLTVPGASPFLTPYVAAVAGTKTADSIANFSANVTPIYNRAVALNGPSVPFVVQFLSGGNDIRNGVSTATIYANYQAYINLVHALGLNAKVVIATTPIQCDIQANSTWNAALQAGNNLIYANWNVPQASGGLGADGLVDYFGDPTIGAGSYGSSAFCNSIYSGDGQHGTYLTKSIMGPIEAAAVAPFFLR